MIDDAGVGTMAGALLGEITQVLEVMLNDELVLLLGEGRGSGHLEGRRLRSLMHVLHLRRLMHVLHLRHLRHWMHLLHVLHLWHVLHGLLHAVVHA